MLVIVLLWFLPCTVQVWFVSAGLGWIWIGFISTFYMGKCLGQPLSRCQHFIDCRLFLAGGHEDFSKMIDEAEPLGYPVVVKSTRGHRGQWYCWARWAVDACSCNSVGQGCSAHAQCLPPALFSPSVPLSDTSLSLTTVADVSPELIEILSSTARAPAPPFA